MKQWFIQGSIRWSSIDDFVKICVCLISAWNYINFGTLRLRSNVYLYWHYILVLLSDLYFIKNLPIVMVTFLHTNSTEACDISRMVHENLRLVRLWNARPRFKCFYQILVSIKSMYQKQIKSTKAKKKICVSDTFTCRVCSWWPWWRSKTIKAIFA